MTDADVHERERVGEMTISGAMGSASCRDSASRGSEDVDDWRSRLAGGGTVGVVDDARSNMSFDGGGRPLIKGESSTSPFPRLSWRMRWAKMRLAGVGVAGCA